MRLPCASSRPSSYGFHHLPVQASDAKTAAITNVETHLFIGCSEGCLAIAGWSRVCCLKRRIAGDE
jgi:hypothetical protein